MSVFQSATCFCWRCIWVCNPGSTFSPTQSSIYFDLFHSSGFVPRWYWKLLLVIKRMCWDDYCWLHLLIAILPQWLAEEFKHYCAPGTLWIDVKSCTRLKVHTPILHVWFSHRFPLKCSCYSCVVKNRAYHNGVVVLYAVLALLASPSNQHCRERIAHVCLCYISYI